MIFFDRKKQKELEQKLKEKEELVKELKSKIEEQQKEIEEQQKEIDRLKSKEEDILKIQNEIISTILSRDIFIRDIYLSDIFQTLGKALLGLHHFYIKSIKNISSDKILFTHHDTDGVACAALFIRCFGENPNIKVFYIKQGERYVIHKVKSKELYVTDLIIDKELGEHLIELKKEGVEVKCIDHHNYYISNDLKRNLINERILIHDKNATSTARLFSKYLGLNDEVSERICKIADAGDGGNVKGVKLDERIVSNLIYLGPYTINKVVKNLVKNGEVRDRELIQQSTIIDLAVEYGKKLLKEKCMYYEDEKLQVYLLKANDFYFIGLSKIISKLFNERKKDLYLFIEGKDTKIKGELSINADFIFSKIAEFFSGNFYSRGKTGTCIVKEMNINIDSFIKFVKELYTKKL